MFLRQSVLCFNGISFCIFAVNAQANAQCECRRGALPEHLQNLKSCAEILTFVPKRLQNATFRFFTYNLFGVNFISDEVF